MGNVSTQGSLLVSFMEPSRVTDTEEYRENDCFGTSVSMQSTRRRLTDAGARLTTQRYIPTVRPQPLELPA